MGTVWIFSEVLQRQMQLADSTFCPSPALPEDGAHSFFPPTVFPRALKTSFWFLAFRALFGFSGSF
jgi:hypothetical protein